MEYCSFRSHHRHNGVENLTNMNRNATSNQAIQFHTNWCTAEADRLDAVARFHTINSLAKFPGEASVSGCRPHWILNQVSNRFSGIWNASEEVLSVVGKFWPDYCHAPLCIWHVAIAQVVNMSYFDSDEKQAELAGLVELINILGNWRTGQGVYRFDPALFKAVSSTPLAGPLSAEIFSHLPEWGIYVETPGLEADGHPLHGFFACLNHAPKTGATLRLALDTEDGYYLCTLSLDQPNISQALLNVMTPLINSENFKDVEKATTEWSQITEMEAKFIEPLVSLICFICTRNDEISSTRGVMPSRPKAKKTKRGERVFPASSPRTWDVGLRLGAALRKYASTQNVDEKHQTEELGSPKRPHLRSGHWHQFRSGPRIDEHGERIPPELRKLSAKWLPPKLVNCTSLDDLVPTLHLVPTE